MAAVSVRIPVEARAKLVALAAARSCSMGDVLAELIEQERRRRLFDDADAAYARMDADPESSSDDWTQ